MVHIIAYIQRNKLIFLSLVFFFLLGLFLRSYRVADFMLWDDSARDIMVGQRLAESNRFWLIAPFSAGSKSYLLNSPGYYYLIAFFWFLVRDPVYVTLIFSLLGSLTVFTNFLIGKEIKNDTVGLIAAFLTAISNTLVGQTSSILQPYVLPFFISLFILCLLKAYKTYSYTYLSGSIVLFWFFYHIHYSILVVSPLFLVGLAITLYRIHQQRKSLLKSGYIFFVFILLFFIWYFLTSRGPESNIFKFIHVQLFEQASTNDWRIKLSNISSIFFHYFDQLFTYTHGLPIWLALWFVIGGVFTTVIMKVKRKRILSTELGMFAFTLSLGFIGLFKGIVMDSYFVIFNTLVPVIIAFLVVTFFNKKAVFAFALVSLFGFYMNMGNFKLRYPTPIYSYKGAQSTAQLIIDDMNTFEDVGIDNVFIGSNLPLNPYNWDAPRYWYFLEHYYGKKNMQLTASFNNLQSTTLSPKFFYLVCDTMYDLEFGDEGCIGDYLDKYPDHLAKKYYAFENPANTEMIYRIDIREDVSEIFYWPLLYRDYMKSETNLN